MAAAVSSLRHVTYCSLCQTCDDLDHLLLLMLEPCSQPCGRGSTPPAVQKCRVAAGVRVRVGFNDVLGCKMDKIFL